MGLNQSRGWRIVQFDRLKAPPEWLAAVVYVFAFAYIVFVIGLGLIALPKLGLDVVFGNVGSPPQVKGEGSGGSPLTVFFTVLVALIGGPVVIWRVVSAHTQAQAALHQAQAALRQADIAQEGHYTDLFTKAVEQLGATREVKRYVDVAKGDTTERELVTVTEPNLEVRLGAIYALDRIARDSERDHWPIMEVLCAYVRNPQNCGEPAATSAGADWYFWLGTIKEPRVDIQAAFTVIGQRPPERIVFETEGSLRLNLAGANLQRAQLSKGKFANANLAEARLESAALDEANLEGASLDEAHLQGARLDGAHLEGASVYLASLVGVWLSGAHLEGARLNGAHLEGAMLSEAHLQGARLDGAHLEGARLDGAHLEGAVLFRADLSEVRGLDPDQLASAVGDDTTTLPEGMQRPANWIKMGPAQVPIRFR